MISGVAQLKNQKRPIVANALLALYGLKKFLFDELGPGSTSLGQTGVERAWWHHHLMNMNRSSVWASNAMRQYRAVVAWKTEVRAAIRKLLHRMGTSVSGNREAQSLVEACDAFEAKFVLKERPPLLLSEAMPIEPADDDINIGLDAFRQRLQGKLDDVDEICGRFDVVPMCESCKREKGKMIFYNIIL